MSLDKVAGVQLGKFGSLTSTAHARDTKSIFGNNIGAGCTYEDSFNSITVGDNGSFDIFSERGKANIEREMDIIQGKTDNKPKAEPRKFEMNEKALMMLKRELYGNCGTNSTIC